MPRSKNRFWRARKPKMAATPGYTMPAFKEKLDPDEIKALVTFVKKFRQ